MTQYAFFVDSDACSGCKTCQVACKDRHDLRAGVHWRRVYEVHGRRLAAEGRRLDVDGGRLPPVDGVSPLPDAGVRAPCSTDAIWKRPDGIVLIDDSRCTKCRKCENDCPYGAIRWDGDANAVRKCTFCVEEVEAGRPPACVAACPNRALDFGEYADLKQKYGGESQVFPLPDASVTGPAVVIRLHRHAALVQGRSPEVANWEEL